MTRPTRLIGGLALAAWFLGACAPAPTTRTAAEVSQSGTDLHEVPPPAEGWRAHRLSSCPPDRPAAPEVEAKLALSAEFFLEGSGGDGMVELEMAVAEGLRDPLLLLVLGQLYLMAGQGDPSLLPREGPLADTGDWDRNKVMLLNRAWELLEEAGQGRPRDAAVDYLLADVARAGGRLVEAETLVIRGWDKCTGGRSFEILRGYQLLSRYPARLQSADAPVYPQVAVAERIEGVVVLDVLLDPAGEVRQVESVKSPSDVLTGAAETVFRRALYAPARIGKYPVWAWLRVSTRFDLEEEPAKPG